MAVGISPKTPLQLKIAQASRTIDEGVQAGTLTQVEATELRQSLTELSQRDIAGASATDTQALLDKVFDVAQRVAGAASNADLDYNQRYIFVLDGLNGIAPGAERDRLNTQVESLRKEFLAHQEELTVTNNLKFNPEYAREFNQRVNEVANAIGAAAKADQDTQKVSRISDLISAGVQGGMLTVDKALALSTKVSALQTALQQATDPDVKFQLSSDLRALLKEVHQARATGGGLDDLTWKSATLRNDYQDAVKAGTISASEAAALEPKIAAFEKWVSANKSPLGTYAPTVAAEAEKTFGELEALVLVKASDNESEASNRLLSFKNRVEQDFWLGRLGFDACNELMSGIKELEAKIPTATSEQDRATLSASLDTFSEKILAKVRENSYAQNQTRRFSLPGGVRC